MTYHVGHSDLLSSRHGQLCLAIQWSPAEVVDHLLQGQEAVGAAHVGLAPLVDLEVAYLLPAPAHRANQGPHYRAKCVHTKTKTLQTNE